MNKAIIGAVVLLVSWATTAHACEFCTLHNGLGQYNNQGDFFSLTYRFTRASTVVSGGAEQPSNGYEINIQTIQMYYQHSFSEELKGIVSVPYFDKNSVTNGDKDSSAGLGDLSAMMRYTVWGDPDQFIGLLGGIKFATGARKTSNGYLNTDLVIGTGSYDGLVGAVYSHNIMNWNYSVDALYKISTTGYDGYRYGNVLNLGVNGYYRVFNFLNIGFGFASEIMAADTDTAGNITGAVGTVDNTGGTVIFAQPTIQYTRQNFYVEAAYQQPVYRNFTGTQTVVDHKMILGMRYAF